MKLINSRLDYSKPWKLPDVYLFTGNPIIAGHGGIVMGAGAAKQVRDTYKGIDKAFASLIKEKRKRLLAFVEWEDGMFVGWAKVKKNWKLNADLEIVEQMLLQLAKAAKDRPSVTFHMNYPAIGNGRIDINQVAPLLEVLPDNVWIYK